MESGDKIASLSLSLLSSARGPPPSPAGGGARGLRGGARAASATGGPAATGLSGGTSDLITAGDLVLAASGDLAAAAAAPPLPGPTGFLLFAAGIPKHKVQIKIDCTLCTLYILVHLYYDVVLVYSRFVHLCDDVVHIRGYIARERRVGTKTSWPHALGPSHCLSRSCGSVAGAKQHFRTKRTQKFTLLFTSRQ